MGEELSRKLLLRQAVRVGLPLGAVPGKVPGGPQDLVPSAVVQADVHLAALVVLGDLPGALYQLPQLRRQGGQVPEELHLHPVPLHLADGLQQILFQQTHDGGDLLRRALPVLGGEGIHGEIVQTDLLAIGGDAAEGLCPGGVTGGAGQPPALGPPAVAVHDDGDVPGQVVKIYLGPLVLF